MFMMNREPRNMNVEHTTEGSSYSTTAPFTGQGERTGEVLTDRAVLHTRLTKGDKKTGGANDGMDGYAVFYVFDNESDAGINNSTPNINNAICHSPKKGDEPPRINNFSKNGIKISYNYRWTVRGLQPNKDYYYRVKTISSDGKKSEWNSDTTYFKTVPLKTNEQKIAFTVVTGFDQMKQPDQSFEVFNAMVNKPSIVPCKPRFIVYTGDTVYYDTGDKRSRWKQWYGLYKKEKSRDFMKEIPGYWQVDDHDYWVNNINKKHMTGWHIFKTVNPTPGTYENYDDPDYYNDVYGVCDGNGAKYWRTIRYGKFLQIWIEEGHHHRTKNKHLNNSAGRGLWEIWNNEQLGWLTNSINRSDAPFKILIPTTPIIGPSRLHGGSAADKHSGKPFTDETRKFLKSINRKKLYIACGDRHWMYHSIFATHAEATTYIWSTNNVFEEFCCGAPITETVSHAGTGIQPNAPNGAVNILKYGGSKGFLFIECYKTNINDIANAVLHFAHRKVNVKSDGNHIIYDKTNSIDLTKPGFVTDFHSPSHPSNDIFYTSNTVTLYWTLSGGEVDAYRLNCDYAGSSNTSYKIFTSEFSLPYVWPEYVPDGINTFSIEARDYDGNFSDPTSITVRVDTTIPEANFLTIGITGCENTNLSNIQLKFNVTDLHAGVAYIKCTNIFFGLDSCEWKPFSKFYNFTLSNIEVDGSNIFVYAKFMDNAKTKGNESETDFAGNISDVVFSSIFLDNVPPDKPYLNINNSNEWANDPAVNLKYSAVGANQISFTYENKTNEYTSGELFTRTWLLNAANGIKTVEVVFIESPLINPSTSAFDTIKLDTEKPEISLYSSSHTFGEITTNPFLDLNWSISDNWWTICVPPETDNIVQTNIALIRGMPNYSPDTEINITNLSYCLTNAPDGTWHFTIRAKDAAGNISDAALFSFVLDRKPPLAPYVWSPTHPSQDKAYPAKDVVLKWRIAPTENPLGYNYIFDKIKDTSPPKINNYTTNSLTKNNLNNGIYYFHIKALGGNGLWSAPAHFKVQIDTSAPPEGEIRNGMWYE